MSIALPEKLTAVIGETAIEASVPIGDTREDFGVCRFELPEGIAGDTLTLKLGDFCSLLDVKILR